MILMYKSKFHRASGTPSFDLAEALSQADDILWRRKPIKKDFAATARRLSEAFGCPIVAFPVRKVRISENKAFKKGDQDYPPAVLRNNGTVLQTADRTGKTRAFSKTSIDSGVAPLVEAQGIPLAQTVGDTIVTPVGNLNYGTPDLVWDAIYWRRKEQKFGTPEFLKYIQKERQHGLRNSDTSIHIDGEGEGAS